MNYSGNILKMRTEIGPPVQYFLTIGNTEVYLNDLLGKRIEFKYTGQINCIRCKRKILKSFAQGYCFPCFQNSPETEECVLRPELCRAHDGIARDINYAKEHCLINHYVYLSFTSNVKVGVTRHTQIPTRWIDQGAIAAIKLASTPNRYTAGLIEVSLKNKFADKTNWRKMLIQNDLIIDLLSEKLNAADYLPDNLKQFTISDNEVTFIEYPKKQLPDKIISINLDKVPSISDCLIAIKGQYLMFESGIVINIRNYGGYNIDLYI